MSQPMSIRRRGFLGWLAAGAAAMTASAIPSPARAANAVRAFGDDPDHWLDALHGKHRQIFDVLSPDKAALGAAFARNFLNANNNGYNLADADVNVVLSFRHASFAMGLNDAMWSKYALGELVGYQDPHANAPAVINTSAGSPGDTAKNSATLSALHARGAVFTVCGMAMALYAGQAAHHTGGDMNTVMTDFRDNLVPGATEVVAGVIAVNRAQERGLSYVYVG
ncbi:MAG TPA: hypothetical protein VIJ16_08315 [Gemmatimonadaceae bacterium]